VTPAPTKAAQPAAALVQNCDIVVHDDSFVVDGERITPKGSTVGQLVLRDGATLVGGDNQLWLVDCKRTPHVKQLIASPSATVRDGRLAPDGHTFLYATGDGIAALDLTTQATRDIYKTPAEPAPNFCAMLATSGSPAAQPRARDDIRSFADDGALIIERRWGCHYPDAYEYRLVGWDSAQPKLHPARPIYDVAADARGTLFIGDGKGLWRSIDRGANWKWMPIKGGDGAAADIFADAKRAGHLVVRTAKGTAISEGERGSDFPGPVLRTRDGGATWTTIALPEAPMSGAVYALSVLDGNVDHLLVATGEPDEDEADDQAPPEGEEGPLIQRVDQGANGFQLASPPPAWKQRGWRATQDGKTWTKAPAPPPRRRTATVKDYLFEATGDGLYRTRGKRELVTPQLAKPYYNDAY